MNDIGTRIKILRKKHDFTQSQLAEKVGLTYVQIGRYEKRGAIPSSEVISKLATALNTTVDFLINGNENISENHLSNNKILNLFKKIETLNEKDKEMIITFLDAFITKKQIQQIVA
ncbi:MAG: helix-turn-helix domain-containing protein [Flavobacteriaceae bacterium]|nr:MAG: helix-turn-helix domain-containing protein [Flavobacteriaceae bacterium]QMU66587.1 MAG: helix-turn-helix domain-containing protein [Flavobacteriaceae bacterium]